MLKITWLGHATFQIEGSKTVLIDPFLNDNPAAPKKADEVQEADVVYVTHDHFDHVADAASILKRTGGTLIATFELANGLAEEHGIQAEPANLGGSVTVDGVTCHLVPAWHTAGRGIATGVVVEMDGRRIYHAGDTCLFSDLGLIGAIFRPDVFLVPIGDRFTMGPQSAAKAVGMVRPRFAIPMHYNTWPPIEQDPQAFARLVADESQTTKVCVLEPGATFELE